MVQQSNKYLAFQLDEELYSIPILKIQEIISMIGITKVPKAPDYVKGVINLRGKIIPIIDLRIKFGLDEKPYDENTSILIIESPSNGKSKTYGAVVDSVKEVADIASEEISPPEEIDEHIIKDFITGIGRKNERAILMLDADKMLNTNPYASAEQSSTEQTVLSQ